MNIVITGASRGIGKALVRYFNKAGDHKLIAISRNRKHLEALIDECKSESIHDGLMVIPFDLSSQSIQNELIPVIAKHVQTVDILVNNAGQLINKPFELLDEDDFNQMFNVNVKSVFLLIQSMIPLFAKNAHIVNISSMGGVQGSVKFPGLSLYSASKGAVAILTECLAEELKDRDIKVNCLSLGAVQTEMLQEAFPGYKAPVTAADMSRFIADFALTGHQFFNGKIIPVSISTP